MEALARRRHSRMGQRNCRRLFVGKISSLRTGWRIAYARGSLASTARTGRLSEENDGRDRGFICGRLFRMARDADRWRRRSEEHTSELQSLMRISYAVFCLKKKKITHHENT